MAVFIIGKTRCPFCKQTIAEGQEFISFPPFVPNEFDPLWVFNDNVFHIDCFNREPLSSKAELRFQEFKQKVSYDNRVCIICSKQIMDPDDYFTLGHLTENKKEALFKYNYLLAHRSCLAGWTELPVLCQELEQLNQSGVWGGKGLERLIAELPHTDTSVSGLER
ncbi:MAG: hypothetical protein ACKVZH_29470 [Blastocatellia bacterium]